MAKARTATPVFSRGSAVLDYWLTHPEGLTIRPGNGRVERATGPVPFGPAESLVVRRRNGRLRRIPAAEVIAVDPAREQLILEAHEKRPAVAGRAVAAWLGPRIAHGCRSLAAWAATRRDPLSGA
jgi:hypothetical protein